MNLGIIGVGYWGRNLLRSFRAIEGVSISFVCDRRADRLHGIVPTGTRMTTDYAEILVDDEVDAVAIATDIPTHYQFVEESLRAGKHVFVEKPLSTHPEEVHELVGLAASSGLVLFVDYLLLFLPALRTIKGMLQQDELGSVQWVHVNRLHPPRDGDFADVIVDFLPHDLSVLHYLFDEFPCEVVSTSQTRSGDGGPSLATILLRFPSGLLANLNLSRIHSDKQRTCLISGTQGTLTWDQGGNQLTVVADASQPGVRLPETMGPEPLLLACQDFVRRSRDRNFTDHSLSVCLAQTYQAARQSESQKRWIAIQ